MRNARITVLALLAAFCVGGTGCMSIFFHNDGTENESTQQDRLHHIGIFSLIEFSDPMNLSQECPNGWRTAKTERGPLAILIGMFTQPIYGPMTVGAGCK